jgi:hypothetical protein
MHSRSRQFVQAFPARDPDRVDRCGYWQRMKLTKRDFWCALLLSSLVGSLGCEEEGEQCIAESACGYIGLVDPGDSCAGSDSPTLSASDVTAAKCVLEALRDGDPGPVSIDRSIDDPYWSCGFRRRISVMNDRNVIVVEGEYEDLGGFNLLRKGKLRSPAHFQKCLDDGPAGYVACLIDPVEFQPGDVDCECEHYCVDVNEQSI